MRERKRQPIAYLFRAGQTSKGMFKATGLPKNTVYLPHCGEAGTWRRCLSTESRRNHKRRSDLKQTLSWGDPLDRKPVRSCDGT